MAKGDATCERSLLRDSSVSQRGSYGLTNQLRRAAVSVPSNLAEGHGRFSRKEFLQFIARARGSLLELETQLEIARDLDYLSGHDAGELLAETGELARLLNGLKAWTEELEP